MINYGSQVFESLRSQANETWFAYVEHEFVKQLGDGSLPRQGFLHYLKQDYIFLIHFARAWALAVYKSDRIDEMRTCAATVHALIDEEMRLHIGTCAAEGIDEATLAATVEEPENLAYTRFVIDIGMKGDLLDLLVALSPCVFGYGEIKNRLAASINGSTADHPYHDWIKTYAGSDYQVARDRVGVLLENVASRFTGSNCIDSPRWPELLKTFEVATRLEADFWGMGLRTTEKL